MPKKQGDLAVNTPRLRAKFTPCARFLFDDPKNTLLNQIQSTADTTPSLFFRPFSPLILCISRMPALSRSTAPLFQSTRFALRRQRGVNPVHHVLGKDSQSIRGLATVFERSKPHVNIGITQDQLHLMPWPKA